MKLLVGAVSAALIATFAAAQAEPLPPSGLRVPYRAVSDFDAPYSEAPPAVVPAPPRYGYGPGPDYGYRDERYAPPPAPVYRQDTYRDTYRDGYQQDYGYAPAYLPVHEVYAILRDNGFSPLGVPRQRGNVYVVSVLDRDGEDGRLVVDARSGRILRFVRASQWGEDYERMRFEPPRGGLNRLPPPTVIRADPRVMAPAPVAPRVANAMPAQLPKVPTPVARPAAPTPQTAALNPKPAEAAKPVAPKPAETKAADVRPAEVKPVDVKPVETKPVDAKPAEAKASEAKPAEAKASEAKASEAKPADAKPVQSAAAAPPTTGSITPAAKPAPQILPTAKMPPAQGLD